MGFGALLAGGGTSRNSCSDSVAMSFLSSSQKSIVDRIGSIVDDVEARMMLGTVGLFARGEQFGVLDDEHLYLQVEDEHRTDFVEAGTEPYNAADVEHAAYLEVPDGVLADEETFATWVERAVETD